MAVSVNGKTSKKRMQKRRGVIWCVKALKGLDTPKKCRVFCTLFFELLPFTDDVVYGKTSKKSMQKKNATFLWCVKTLRPRHTKKNVAFFRTLFLEVLPFTDDASVVYGKTSKKSMQKRRR